MSKQLSGAHATSKRLMARPAPAIPRAAAILNLLAAHPTERFTLSDILRAVHMNRATLHATLASLEDVGFLYRANDKSYSLGPALIRIARTARDDVSPMSIAKLEMRAVADEEDAVCSAVFRVRDELVVRERAASASHLAWTDATLARFPLDPPIGLVFMAWAAAADSRRWLNKLGPRGSLDRDRQEAALEFPRVHGFSCGVRKHKPSRHEIGPSHARLLDTDFAVDALVAEKSYAMTFVASPIFDESGKVAFALVLTGFGLKTGSEVETLGKALRARCDRITAATGGVVSD